MGADPTELPVALDFVIEQLTNLTAAPQGAKEQWPSEFWEQLKELVTLITRLIGRVSDGNTDRPFA